MKYAWGTLSFTSERKCRMILKNIQRPKFQVIELILIQKQESRSPSFSDERSGMTPKSVRY